MKHLLSYVRLASLLVATASPVSKASLLHDTTGVTEQGFWGRSHPVPTHNPGFDPGVLSLDDKDNGELQARADCRAIQAQQRDSCGSLASRCKIRESDFTKYNTNKNLCSTLAPGQWVCCSSGNLPDNRPKPQKDGTCHAYSVKAGDTCHALAQTFGITQDNINAWNKDSWGWAGCTLQKGQIICLSTGNSPMPPQVSGVQCGPQKPGTRKPSGHFTGKDLAKLNPCPLNACCDAWGFCGTTREFCTPSRTDTGAPGTHKPGTHGCISNCGTDIKKSASPPPHYLSIGYFQGYGLSKPCNGVDIRTIDLKKYTHIHFAFATIANDTYKVNMGPTINQFYYFKRLKAVKKILSFGGWTFSTDPATYGVFRRGVSSAHRDTMASNIAKFVVENDLDGVDIDWEYPGAPDLPGIPRGAADEGANYLKFLVKVKSLLPSGKTVSFAAPASYWYLKSFPIADIVRAVDYVVYMTYDLHGQWDYNNKWSMEGCPGGNCLRSHINMTETLDALSMITKAGVPSNKIAVGVTSYGRSFKMTKVGCSGPTCSYVGPLSHARKGECTATAGYIAQSEIDGVLKNNPSAKTIHDKASQSDILVYNKTEWVSYMSHSTKDARKKYFQGLNFLGTSDWSVDLDVSGTKMPNADTMNPDGPSLLPKGLLDLKIHDNCHSGRKGRNYLPMIQEAWFEAGDLAKATMQWKRSNKFQRVLNNYLGKRSAQVPILGVDHIWNNFVAHYDLHFGGTPFPDDPPTPNIYTYIYCNQNDVPKKVKSDHKVRCVNSDGENAAAVTYRYPGRWGFWSEYYILLCPAFFGEVPGIWFKSLAKAAAGATTKALQTQIKTWSSGIRAVTMYHEVSHFQDISWPHCDKNEYYKPKEIVIMAQSGNRDQYEELIRNAHSWALSAVCMWAMQRWPDIDVPMPKGKSPQKRGATDPDDEPDVPSVLVDDYFDPSEVDPSQFEWLSRIGNGTQGDINGGCTEGLYEHEKQCHLFCSSPSAKCAKEGDYKYRCSNCHNPTRCSPGRYNTESTCSSNCLNGSCMSWFNAGEKPYWKCDC